jgi:hypothetical protein
MFAAIYYHCEHSKNGQYLNHHFISLFYPIITHQGYAISNDKIMVFYTLEDEVEHEGKLNKVKDICNVAFFRGSNEDGWEIVDDDGWSKFVNKDMETYDDTFFFKEDGASKDIAVMYGRIHNPEIVRVEIGNDETEYLEATIFQKNGINYFYGIYHVSQLRLEKKGTPSTGEVMTAVAQGFTAKGISKDGKVIIEQRGE